MSIRPVDPQSVLHKAGESQRTTAASREQPSPGQHHFLQELQQRSVRRQQMVRQADDAEANKLHTDERQNKQQQKQDQRRGKQPRQKQTILHRDRNRGTHLDIKV